MGNKEPPRDWGQGRGGGMKRVLTKRTPEQIKAAAGWMLDQILALPSSMVTQSASEWIEKNMVITEGNYPGPYSFKLTPYLREIADNMSVRSNVIETVLIKGNQLGGSVISFGVIAYYIAKGIGPILFVGGDQSMAGETFEKRLDPILESAGLREKIKPIVDKKNGGARATGDTKEMKAYAGTFLRAVGPNSEGKLRSFPSRINVVEEIDVFPQSLKGTGNPVEKIVRRADSFGPLRRIYYNSTPKQKSTSQIEPLVESGDRRKFMWACPKCGYQQPFEFGGFAWDRNEHGSPDIIMDDTGRVTKDPVYYICQNPAGCDARFTNADKYKLMETAVWVPTKKPDRPGIRSYILPTFYSPFRSWLDIFTQYWRVKDDPLLYPDFVNDVCAECSESTVATPLPSALLARALRSAYKTGMKIPNDVAFLTLTCDVQKNRLEASLVGWGCDIHSHMLDYWTLEGDPSKDDSVCWENLANRIEASYEREDGVVLQPIVTFIDAGFLPSQVRNFCAKYEYRSGRVNGVYPVIGRDDYVAKGRNYKISPADYGAPEIVVNDQHFKKAVYFYLGRESENDDGYMHFPSNVGQVYFDGLTAETMSEEVNPRTGKKSTKIMNPKGRRNEPLDLYKLAFAALYFMCGEYYGSINRRLRAAKKQEVQVDLKAFLRMMDDGTRMTSDE